MLAPLSNDRACETITEQAIMETFRTAGEAGSSQEYKWGRGKYWQHYTQYSQHQ